jgi:hypothetical protein
VLLDDLKLPPTGKDAGCDGEVLIGAGVMQWGLAVRILRIHIDPTINQPMCNFVITKAIAS